jgi:hypothetical protein
MHGGRIVIANHFYPSTQTCLCRSICGPKGREQMGVERCVYEDCGAQHGRDYSAAVIL